MSSPLLDRMIQEGGILPNAAAGPPISFGDPAREAAAALHGCVVAGRWDLGQVRMLGKDRQDFLHRLSTNDIKSLKPGEGAFTAILNTKGRVLDLLQALAGETELLLITSPGATEKVRSWLDSYLFREQVSLEAGEGASLPCLGLYGPDSAGILERLAGGGWTALPPVHHRMAEIAGTRIRVARSFPLGGSGFLLFGLGTDLLPAWEVLRGSGAVPAGSVALERLRVAAGVPGWGRELVEDYNPWEAGLGAAVSLDKGCYLGQEIVARLHNYRKVQRRLSGIRLEGPPPPAGSAVLDGEGGEEIGLITSAELSPGGEGSVALAILGIRHIGENREIRVAVPEGQSRGWVVSLPFEELARG
jgi:tRNA-modifying protein YgfZ